MKFKTTRELLIKPLQLVYGAVERRQTLPILGNLLLEVEGGALALTGTDQEVEITGHAEVQDAEGGEVTVPARKLMEICRNLPEHAIIDAELEERRLALVSGRFRSHLATLPATEFPNVEMVSGHREITVAAAQLRRLLERTSFAMAQQDVRYFFNGLLLEMTPQHLRAVATNGQRLAMCTVAGNTGVAETHQSIIPRKGVSELNRLVREDSEPVRLQFSENHLRAIAADGTLTTKLIDGAYPDYEKAIPTRGDQRLTGDRNEIREALTRTSILSNEMYRNVRLELADNTLRLQANNPQQEEAEEIVSVNYTGDPLEIAFNVEYLLDAMGVMGGAEVIIDFSGPNGPARVQESGESDSLYVISPMVI